MILPWGVCSQTLNPSLGNDGADGLRLAVAPSKAVNLAAKPTLSGFNADVHATLSSLSRTAVFNQPVLHAP